MITPISFFVAGLAKPAGSKRGFFIAKIKRVVIVDACKGSKDWKTDVKHTGMMHYKGDPLTCPLSVRFDFIVTRPQSHYRSGKNEHLLKDGAPQFPTSKPDVLKLSRGVEDALTAIIWKDDSQIVTERITKRYGTTPGVNIEIKEEIE